MTDIIHRDAAFERWWQTYNIPEDEEPADRAIALRAWINAWAVRDDEVAALRAIISELVSCVPWKDAMHLGDAAYCDWCGLVWKDEAPRPTLTDHAKECAWRHGREAIGAPHDTEW